MNTELLIKGIQSFAKKATTGMFINSVTAGTPKGEALLNSQPADFGYNVDITTLTYIRQQVVEQVFYEVAVADYMQVEVGNGAFFDEILTWKSYLLGDDFFKGMIKQGVNSRIQRTDVALEKITYPAAFWAGELNYSIIEVEQASRTGNWSLIEQKEIARKTQWDLGIQELAFLGHPDDAAFKGLLNLTSLGVNSNTALITEPLSTMDAETFTGVIAGLIKAYQINNNFTSFPDTFAIPQSDFLGLSVPYNYGSMSSISGYRTRLEWLEATLKGMTGNANAKVKPLVYSDQLFNNLSLNRYALYNSKDDTLRLDIPVNYTSTLAGTSNNFQWSSVGYGQFTGVQLYRPLNILYFDYAN